MTRRNKVPSSVKEILLYCILTVIVVFYLFPFLWLVSTSVKPTFEQLAIPPVFVTHNPTLENFKDSIQSQYRLIINSLLVAFCSTGISLLVGSFGGYAFSRFRFPGSGMLFFLVLTTRMFPPISIVIPIFLLMRNFQLLDSPLGLIVAYISFQLPFMVWMMRSFFVGIPRDTEDSARVDGCSRLGAFLRVVLPMALPGAAAAGIIGFLTSWNEFIFALILTNTDVAKTMPVGIAENVTAFSVRWGQMAAGATVFTVPVLLLSVVVQRYIVSGMTLGAVK